MINSVRKLEVLLKFIVLLLMASLFFVNLFKSI